MIGAVTAIVLALIAFVTLSDFPAPSESAGNTAAPAQDLKR